MSAIDDVAAERRRQIEEEGWTPQHDERCHPKGELSMAGACYAFHASNEIHPNRFGFWSPPPSGWPFHESWWKPSKHGPRRDLVKAAALIVAEIDRLDAAENGR